MNAPNSTTEHLAATRPRIARLAAATLLAISGGCISPPLDGDSSSAARRQFPLDSLAKSTVTLGGETFEVWLADTPAKQSEGLMFVSDDEIADNQGMLFVFQDERLRSFWMKNTIISLDIAFARADGEIVAIHTMPPLTLRGFPSIEP
ncbi:MAG: DUF192 domain-containing protein, partial [Planctomycetota bacterium]